MSDMSNKLTNLIFDRFSNSTILAFLVLTVYYIILQLFCSIKFFPTKFFFISSMKITFLNDLEARIASAVVAAVQQAILEAKVVTGVQQTLCSLNFQPAPTSSASESAAELVCESVYKSVFKSAFKSVFESIFESVSELAAEFVAESVHKSVHENASKS